VASYVAALREALGDDAVGALPERWIPLDPELTQPGNKPSLVPGTGDLPDPVPPRRRRWPAAVLAVVLLVAGSVGGFAVWRNTHGRVSLTDDSGVLSVTVPRGWARDVSPAGWNPPDVALGEPALSAGDGRDWQRDGQGVFVGLIAATGLPTTLPQHPGCTAGTTATGSYHSDPAKTVVSTGCGAVLIERVVQVSAGQLLWVQVRSDDRATAEQVLDSVRTHGAI
jgi:hypothetical protein